MTFFSFTYFVEKVKLGIESGPVMTGTVLFAVRITYNLRDIDHGTIYGRR